MADFNVTDASFKGFKFHVATPPKGSKFGVQSQDIVHERRIQVSERAFVDGADVEDFGAKPRTFSAEVIFFGDDYKEEIKAFLKILYEGTTGILILPMLPEAVYAKFQRASERTSSDNGSATIFSISWIEDKTTVVQTTDFTATQAAQSALSEGNTEQSIPTIQEKTAAVLKNANASLGVLNNNKFISTLKAAESAVTSTRVTINSALNVPRTQRQAIISTVGKITSDIDGLKTAVNGIKNFTDLLSLGISQASPTRFNTGLGAADFAAVDEVSTTVVSGVQTVVVTKNDQAKNIQSFNEAVSDLDLAVAALDSGRKELEVSTEGSTSDFTLSAVALINSVKDLAFIIREKPTRQILTQSRSSLLEVCFNNGLTVADIEKVHRLNSQIDDILDIPAFSVVNL